MTLHGAILAGGDSRRMGSDKAMLDTGSGPWWLRQRELLLRIGCSEIVLLRREGQTSPAEIPCIRDIHTGMGPLAGIHAALRRVETGHLAVLAVDMQHLLPDWFTHLLSACHAGCGAAFEEDGTLEPLAAVYPAGAAPLVDEAIRAGRLGAQSLVRELVKQERMRLLPLPGSLKLQAANLNRPEDLT